MSTQIYHDLCRLRPSTPFSAPLLFFTISPETLCRRRLRGHLLIDSGMSDSPKCRKQRSWNILWHSMLSSDSGGKAQHEGPKGPRKSVYLHWYNNTIAWGGNTICHCFCCGNSYFPSSNIPPSLHHATSISCRGSFAVANLASSILRLKERHIMYDIIV